jgi:hypothetical protein
MLSNKQLLWKFLFGYKGNAMGVEHWTLHYNSKENGVLLSLGNKRKHPYPTLLLLVSSLL